MEPGEYELGVSEHLKSEEIMVKNIKYTWEKYQSKTKESHKKDNIFNSLLK